MKRFWKVVLLMVLAGSLIGGSFILKRELNVENKMLREMIEKREKELKEKEIEIEKLTKTLERLQYLQKSYEQKISELEKEKQQVKPPQSLNEIVKRFARLGYQVYVRGEKK
jgi:septal ring factor EnvC (AmiA/AmiB activator)